MSKIKQVLQLYRNGLSSRRIAVELGLDKGTVNQYIRKVKDGGFDIGDLLGLEDPELQEKFSAGNPAYTQDRYQAFKDKLPYFEKELGRRHVKRRTLWEEYIGEHPDGYRYTQFCHHLNQMLVARRPSAILEHTPGMELHIDFCGDTMSYVDRQTGEVIKVQVFIACFPYSDYTFAMAVPSQGTDDFLHALRCALEYFGGSPKVLVPDNLKAAVIKTDRYESDLNRVMEDFGNHYGITVLPARPRRPCDKASAENHVKIIYSRVYAKLRNQVFFCLQELNSAIADRIRDHNQTRMQQKPYSRQEKFLAEEKPALSSLPEKGFEMKYYASLKVAVNNCILLGRDKHYYSVPYTYIGRQVSVVYTRSIVRVYCGGQCVATHPRTIGYGYTTQKEHLCSTHRYYRERSPEYYIRRAEERSPALALLIRKNFEQEEIPERIYKRCDGLLSLQRKTNPATFEKACGYAIDCGVLSYKSLVKIIRNKAYQREEDQQPEENQPRSPHQNIRGKGYYQNYIQQELF